MSLYRVSSSHARQFTLFGPVHAPHPAAQATGNLNGYGKLHDCTYLPTQFPDEFKNSPPLQLSVVHTLGAVPRSVSDESLQVKQCAGLAGLEQVAQES